MRLSEAIRKGAAMTGQTFGTYAETDENMQIQKTCCLGAAIVGHVEHVDGRSSWRIGEFRDTYPLLDRMVPCPAGCKARSDVENIIIHLNDNHEWSRRDIADWVETFEEDSIPVDVGVPAEKSADMALAPEEAPV